MIIMCTSFVRKGKDLIVGFNYDVDPNVWKFKVYPEKDIFYVGLEFEGSFYKIHGVNKNGQFGNLLYMNDLTKGIFDLNKKRIDLLINDYISNNISYNELLDIVKNNDLVNAPNLSFHSQVTDINGNVLLIEPGIGFKEIKDDFSIITNFSIFDTPNDLSFIGYGKDRYDIGLEILKKSDETFNVKDGLDLLNAVKQEGPWATRLSFLYSKNDNAVYYFIDGNRNDVKQLKF